MKILSVLIVAAVAAGALYTMYGSSPNEVDLHFTNFVTKFDKNYLSEDEYNFRKTIFADNLKIINEHNTQGKSWTMGVNEFTDWTNEEYKKMLGYKPKLRDAKHSANLRDMPVNCKKLERQSIDWIKAGYVGPVKNQGSCGSCWTFSAVGALEGAYAKLTGKFVQFSEQQLVECDKFSHGCNGGLMENGFMHWMRYAPRTEDDYKYTLPPTVCKESEIPTSFPELKFGYRVDIGWECVYEALTHGVTSVAIRAENDAFRHYKSGIISGESCGTDLDHGVTLVGYDVETDAWLIKNSWGPTWGENGYVRIKRGEGKGICGINQENSQPVFDDEEF